METPVTTSDATMPAAEYPPLIKRIQSFFIDIMLIVLVMFAITALLDKVKEVPDWLRGALFIGLWFVYEPLCISLGCTAGQYLTRIRVRQEEQEDRRINIFMSFLRFIIKVLLGWLSFLTMHMNPQKRAIHDFISGSVVVEAR